MSEQTTVAIFGAAGSMGTRSSNALKGEAAYEVLCVEAGVAGIARLRDRGLAPTPQDEALARADVVVLAVPDALIGTIAAESGPRCGAGRC